MNHPFDLSISDLELVVSQLEAIAAEEAEKVEGGRSTLTTLALGEEGGCFTSYAVGEEGGVYTTLAMGEEGGGLDYV